MLLEAFLREVDAPAAWRSKEGLERELHALVDAARAAHPSVTFAEEACGAVLGRAVKGNAELDGLSPELLLANAALSGEPSALRAIDTFIVAEAKHAAQHLRSGPSFADELAQQVRQRVLAPPEPKLAEYAGRGSLKKWLRATAMRLGLNLMSFEGRHRTDGDDDDDALGQLQASAASPELALVKAETAAHFTEALRVAFTKLSPKERNLLRLYFLDGVSSAQLAQTYGTHRVTVTRWLASARATVIEAAVSQLRSLGVLSTASAGDLHWLVRSQLSTGWTDALRDDEG